MMFSRIRDVPSLGFGTPQACRTALVCAIVILLLGCAGRGSAQEAYFVTYSHQMEEPGNLEIDSRSVAGRPSGGNAFLGSALEFEYGATAWWTSELYVDGQKTAGEGTAFTGFRWENRARLLLREHWINPVLYAEFEDISSADKALLEVVGHDGRTDFLPGNAPREMLHEAELRLILSSDGKAWNVSENFIAEKNLNGNPWEFGYALGVSRPLSLVATPRRCSLCRETITLGAELYGGLGEASGIGLHDTSHYLAPVVSWTIPNGPMLKLSPTFGLNGNSHAFLLRFGIAYEIQQLAARFERR